MNKQNFIEKKVEKFNEFLERDTNYIVEDRNDPRVGILARDVLRAFFIQSLNEVWDEAISQGYLAREEEENIPEVLAGKAGYMGTSGTDMEDHDY